MGELTSGGSPEQIASNDNAVKDSGETGFDTDVPDVKADGEKLGIPVFKVDNGEFYQNMAHGRKRLRFKTGSNVQQYMQKTKYQRPFWISHDDDKGQTWTRKIK